jgi:hypothetical protein
MSRLNIFLIAWGICFLLVCIDILFDKEKKSKYNDLVNRLTRDYGISITLSKNLVILVTLVCSPAYILQIIKQKIFD